MELLNSFSLCIFVNRYLQLSKKTNLWEILSNNIYSIFDKNNWKAVNRMLISYSWKLFIKIFINVVAVRHDKWKVFQKQISHLTSIIYLLLRCSAEKETQLYINIETIHPISLAFFQISFLSILVFSSFLCFVFCLTMEAATWNVL